MTDPNHECSEIPDEQRKLAKTRDNYTCQAGGRVGQGASDAQWERAPPYQDDPVALEVHHKIPPELGGTHKLENLITLCEEHHRQLHHDPVPPTNREPGLDQRTVSRLAGIPDGDSTEAEAFAEVARRGPVRTGRVAEAIDVSKEHARRLLYGLGARDLVVPTRDGGWDLADHVEDPPIEELPDSPELAALRVRDELLRRAAELGVEHSDLAEIADLSPRTVRVAIDRAATYDIPVPKDVDIAGISSAIDTAPVRESERDDLEVWGED